MSHAVAGKPHDGKYTVSPKKTCDYIFCSSRATLH